ncbi:hypothetical protein PV328_001738 [Microctonus aethiopoides]|uniref:Uncharacterized protein n=1 Tax=Microctonus aethiopoides TaxID=144406 RepID=A0AA39KXX0_9HYME|nr:hypothetical protein PV328_001738 [Microctonus aethiopoides]
MPQGRKGESNGIDEEGDGIDDVRGKNEGGKEDEDEDKKKKKKKKKGKWMCHRTTVIAISKPAGVLCVCTRASHGENYAAIEEDKKTAIEGDRKKAIEEERDFKTSPFELNRSEYPRVRGN